MAERSRPKFGDKLPPSRGRVARPAALVPHSDDLPNFTQAMLPGMPDVDYDHLLEKDRHRGQNVRGSGGAVGSGTLWRYDDPSPITPLDQTGDEPARQLRKALAAYQLDARKLRRLAALGTELTEAIKSGEPPPELVHLL